MITKKKLIEKSSRKFRHIEIFLSYLFVMSTFITLMYYYNADTDLDFITNLSGLYTMESGDTRYDRAFEKIIDHTRYLTLCVVSIHIGAFSEAMWYIINVCFINFLYGVLIILYFGEIELLYYIILLIIISLIVQNVASDDLNFNCKMLVFFCKVIFHNFFIFIIFGVLGYFALDFVLFLILFKTMVFESYILWSLLILVLLWSFSFVISLLENIGSSVTIFYLVNQETFTSFFVFKNTLSNLLYNLGNISVGKLYLYEFTTFIFLKNEYDNFDFKLENVPFIIIWTFKNILIDLFTIIFSDVPSFRMSYTSLYNCNQFNAMVNVESIMFERHYYEEFRNYFLKLMFGIIIVCILPVNYYIYQYCLFEDKISIAISLENKTMLYCIMNNAIILYITFVFFFSVSTTILYVYILWPKFFNLIEKKYIDNPL